MTKYYINLILLLISLLGFTSINNIKVLATTTNPNAVTTLFISEIAYDTRTLDYNQKCGPTDSKASCSFDKWFEIYNPSLDTSVKLSDLYFSVNDGKNLNQIVSSDQIKPQGYAVIHNSRVASGVIDTFKIDKNIATGKSGWLGSISGQSGNNYNVHLGIYYKDTAGNGVLINARNISSLPSQATSLRKTIEFNSPDSGYTLASQSFLKIGNFDFYGSPSTGLIPNQTKIEQSSQITQPSLAKNPITPATSQLQAQQLKTSQNQTNPVKTRVSVSQTKQTTVALNTKYVIESGSISQLNIQLKKLKSMNSEINLSPEMDQILVKNFKPVSGVNLNYSHNDFSYKLIASKLLKTPTHFELIFLDALILTLIGLKLITRSKVLKSNFSTQAS